jgi:RND superfamily putative drug exporter
MATAQRIVEHDPEVVSVVAPQLSTDRRAYEMTATLRDAPESPVAVSSIYRMRRELRAGLNDPHRAVAIGGTTATSADATDDISHNLWKVIVGVLLLSYVCLLIVLRSAIVPIKAIIMNLLTIGAATGVLVMVFQWGWLDGLLGIEPIGQVGFDIPPLVFAVVYGLSMDYELFLVTRIQERYRRTGDNRSAVAEGVLSSARAISCAALFMVLIFATFVATNATEVQEIGIGAGVAIAIDATLGRLVLLPATMTLLGDWNWWMPHPLTPLLRRRRRTREELSV